jgi:threonine aldolase
VSINPVEDQTVPMDSETLARRAACTRFLSGDGFIGPQELLATIPDDVVADVYGEGGVVEELEAHVAELLGKPAAVFLPSGTMAQGAALRVHADARASRTVLWHPWCHLDNHESGAHLRLHNLVGRPVGGRNRLITLEDLEDVAEPVAALLLELPQRDLGGELPAWDDLVAQVGWAGEHGAAAHLDGARLWEASAGYACTPAEISALFDTVYVSFYKGIGALPGCCLAGSESHIAQAREWRHRLGGTLYALWPGAASALTLLPERLAEMPARLEHARAIAEALRDVPGVGVVPEVPQTAMMHLLLEVTAEQFTANARRLAEEELFWTYAEPYPTEDPRQVRVEVGVGRATCALTTTEVVEAVTALIDQGS